jgi:hypothetical protein
MLDPGPESRIPELPLLGHDADSILVDSPPVAPSDLDDSPGR